MKILIYMNFLLLLSSCGHSYVKTDGQKGTELDPKSIKSTKWLYQDFGDCKEIYSFSDSTFILNSCEVAENFHGDFWINNDTLFLLIPKPKKQKVIVSGDTVELDVQMLHYIRPTLEKMYYKNDTLFFIEIYKNYKEENQRKITNFKIGYLTRLDN